MLSTSVDVWVYSDMSLTYVSSRRLFDINLDLVSVELCSNSFLQVAAVAHEHVLSIGGV